MTSFIQYLGAASTVAADGITSSAVLRDLKPSIFVTCTQAIEIVSFYYYHVQKEEVETNQMVQSNYRNSDYKIKIFLIENFFPEKKYFRIFEKSFFTAFLLKIVSACICATYSSLS